MTTQNIALSTYNQVNIVEVGIPGPMGPIGPENGPMVVESTGYGIASGLQVTAATPPSMNVLVSNGVIHMQSGLRYLLNNVSPITINAADTTLPRIDLVYISASGVVTYLAGTAASSPVTPTLPSCGVPLAKIAVAANTTTITNSNITDVRKIKPRFQNFQFANVVDYGAVGDGANDDTAAIKKAVATGYNVYFPQTVVSRYLISDEIIPVGNQTIFGATRSVVISQTTAGKNCFTVSGVSNSWIKDLTLGGVGSSSNEYGIYVTNSNPTHLDNLNIQGFSQGVNGTSTNNLFLYKVYAVNNNDYGINLVTVVDGWITDSFAGGTTNASKTGIGLAFTGICNGIWVSTIELQTNDVNFKAQQNSGSGVPGEIFISQCINDNANVHGYYLDYANDIEFSNCWASNRGTGKNFYISPNVTDIRLTGGKIFDCTGHGIEIQGTGCTINGTSIQDASYNAANTYDNIYVGTAAVNTRISGGARSFKYNTTPRYSLNNASDTTIVSPDVYLAVCGTGSYNNSAGYSTNVTRGYLCANIEAPSTVGLGSGHTFQGITNLEDYPIAVFRRKDLITATIFGSNGGDGSGTNCMMRIRSHSTTGRSINAGGTINTSGADYAEYMIKDDSCGIISKGSICGINASGKLTDKFTDAISFVVKSTNPSYVGGDTWGSETIIGAKPEPPIRTEEQTDTEYEGTNEYQTYKTSLTTWESALEAARAKVDRIAFSGQVSVNVTGATAGQYIIPVQDGTGIKGQLVNASDITFDQYKIAVGRVIAIEGDGRARIIVKVA